MGTFRRTCATAPRRCPLLKLLCADLFFLPILYSVAEVYVHAVIAIHTTSVGLGLPLRAVSQNMSDPAGQ